MPQPLTKKQPCHSFYLLLFIFGQLFLFANTITYLNIKYSCISATG